MPPPTYHARTHARARTRALFPLSFLHLRVLMGSKPDTAVTATTMAPSTTPPAMTELTRFFREGVTAA